MFGDKILVGYSSTNIDEKNRLRLPKFTCAGAGEKLVVVPDGNRLLIYSSTILEEYVDKIDEIKDIKTRKELLAEFRTFCEGVLVETTVDKNNRINLSDNLHFNDKNVELQGAGDRVILYGDFSYPELYKKRG